MDGARSLKIGWEGFSREQEARTGAKAEEGC